MNKQLRMKPLAWVLASMFLVPSAFAQNTSAAASGRVTDGAGHPVAGAKIEVVHVPSGTKSTITTDADGRYQ